MAAHEDLRRSDEVKLPSERSFGLVMTGFFGLVGLAPLFRQHTVRPWALVVAGAFALVTLVASRALRPLNYLWFQLGQLLNRVVSPLVLGVLFYVVVLPMGLILRLSQKDPLRLRFASDLTSYWISRKPPGPAPDTMRNQY